MATAIAQPRNAVVDVADVVGKLSPLLLGSGKTNTTTSSSSSIDPSTLAQSDDLMNMLLSRGSSTAQSDNVVNDILYRAQLAFAPVLGDEKMAGMYNTSTKNLLAKESVARATAAASQAVLEDQQRALAQATTISNQRVAASRTQTQTQSAKTAPSISGKGLLAGVGTSILASMAMKKGKEALDKSGIFDKKAGKGIDTGDAEDASGNLYAGGDSFDSMLESGAQNSVGSAGELGAAMSGDASLRMASERQGVLTAEDSQALQELLDSTVIPTAGDPAAVSLVDSGQTKTDASSVDAATGTSTALATSDAMAVQAASINATALQAGMDPATIDTLGPIATAKALEAQGIDLIPPMPPAGGDVSGVPGADVNDPLNFAQATTSTMTDAGGDVAANGGIQVASETGSAYDPSVWAADDADMALNGADLALDAMPVPYFAIANALTGGELGKAVQDIPVVGDVLQGFGEVVNDIPVVGDAVNEFGLGINDLVTGLTDAGGGLFEAAGDVFDEAGDIFSGDCFITTAATKGGEDDDGYTLTKMRDFRDKYMLASEDRTAEVDDYYRTAPAIVKKISAHPDAELIWQTIREKFLTPCVYAWNQGDGKIAHKIYRELIDYAKAV
jgi:hypothetical protein